MNKTGLLVAYNVSMSLVDDTQAAERAVRDVENEMRSIGFSKDQWTLIRKYIEISIVFSTLVAEQERIAAERWADADRCGSI